MYLLRRGTWVRGCAGRSSRWQSRLMAKPSPVSPRRWCQGQDFGPCNLSSLGTRYQGDRKTSRTQPVRPAGRAARWEGPSEPHTGQGPRAGREVTPAGRAGAACSGRALPAAALWALLRLRVDAGAGAKARVLECPQVCDPRGTDQKGQRLKAGRPSRRPWSGHGRTPGFRPHSTCSVTA